MSKIENSTYSQSIEGLKKATWEFFRAHWNLDRINKWPPCWSDRYYLVGPLPNNHLQGNYAFISKEEVVYIGVGAGRNPGRYEGAGLGSRLNKYMRVKKGGRSVPEVSRPYEFIEQWADVDSLVTIGFDREEAYLAYALEVFLISSLDPKYNSQKPGQ